MKPIPFPRLKAMASLGSWLHLFPTNHYEAIVRMLGFGKGQISTTTLYRLHGTLVHEEALVTSKNIKGPSMEPWELHNLQNEVLRFCYSSITLMSTTKIRFKHLKSMNPIPFQLHAIHNKTHIRGHIIAHECFVWLQMI